MTQAKMTFKPFLPWMGGKRKLAAQIIEHFSPHTTYVEAFAGGAAVLFAKKPSKVEVINDLNGDVVNLYRVVRFHLEELIKEYKWILISREEWEAARMKRPELQTDVQRAASFYYLIKLSFGSRGTTFNYNRSLPPKFNLLRVEEELAQAHLRLARVTVERLTWQKCVKMYDHSEALFYFDPPYWQVTGYEVPFEWTEYEQLRETMLSLKGNAILSLNGHEDILSLFDDKNFTVEHLKHRYTISSEGHVDANEVIIMRKVK